MGLAAIPPSQNAVPDPVRDPASDTADGHLAAYLDPFNSECRAYARLREAGKEHLAVRCHGYLCFSESYLEESGATLGAWPRLSRARRNRRDVSKPDSPGTRGEAGNGCGNPVSPDEDNDDDDDEGEAAGSVGENRLVYALLKDLAPEAKTDGSGDGGARRPTRAELAKMARDLLALHRVGIFLGGALTPTAYVAGRLVDLAASQTVPHPLLDGASSSRRGSVSTAATVWTPRRAGPDADNDGEGAGVARTADRPDPMFADQVAFDEQIVDWWNRVGEEEAASNGKPHKFQRFPRAFCPESSAYRRLRGGEDREFVKGLRVGEGWFNPADYKWDVKNSETKSVQELKTRGMEDVSAKGHEDDKSSESIVDDANVISMKRGAKRRKKRW